MAQALVALDAGVGQRGVLVAAEREHGLVHVGAVEDVERDEQVEVVDGQAGDGLEQVRLQLGDDVLEGVLADSR